MHHYDISKKELSERIDVHYNTINNFLKEDANPTFRVLVNITEAFPEINPTWLLTGKEPKLLSNNVPEYEERLRKLEEEFSEYKKKAKDFW